MMNGLSMCLVLSSLVTVGIWSPPTPSAGYRVVVVEYEKERGDPDHHGNTRVSISPQETTTEAATTIKGAVEDAKEKIKEDASSVLPPEVDRDNEIVQRQSTPRELDCDALGKCKHKIAIALGKAKEKVFETAHEVSEKAQEVEEEAKEAVSEAPGKAKEAVSHKVDEISGKAREVKQGAKDTASEVSRKAKETVLEQAHRVEGCAKETVARSKHGSQTVVDTSKSIGKDVQRNISRTMGHAEEKAEQAGEVATETVKTGAKKLKEELNEDVHKLKKILRRVRQVSSDVLSYFVSPRTMDSLMGVVHLLGFSTAYGMCMWVTFVSSYVLGGALPKQQFGMLQSKIYPVYFKVMAYSVLVALVGHLLSRRKRLFSIKGEALQGYYLLASLLMLLFNSLYLEPRATTVMFERMKMEKEEGRGRVNPVDDQPATMPERLEPEADQTRFIDLSERLKKLNSYSSLLNILTLVALTCHLVYLGKSLHVSC